MSKSITAMFVLATAAAAATGPANPQTARPEVAGASMFAYLCSPVSDFASILSRYDFQPAYLPYASSFLIMQEFDPDPPSDKPPWTQACRMVERGNRINLLLQAIEQQR